MHSLSIITVNFNNAIGLKKTIESVLSQSFIDFEFIIIDGASIDDSVKMLDIYRDKLSHAISEKDSGIYNAMNKGIKLAKGEYCLFLNSGDYLVNKDVLKNVFKSNNSEDILYGDMIISTNGKKIYGNQPEEIMFEFMVLTTLWHPVSFIKRSLFDKCGYFNEQLKIISDYEFFLKAIILNNVSTRHLPFPVAVFNTDGIGSNSKYKSLHERERREVLEKHFPVPVIESAIQFNLLKQSRAVVFSNWLKLHPFLFNISLAFYNILNRLRKLFNI